MLFQCSWQKGVLGCDAFELQSERISWIVCAYLSLFALMSKYLGIGLLIPREVHAFSDVVQLFFVMLLPCCVICWSRRGLESEECGFLPNGEGRGEQV